MFGLFRKQPPADPPTDKQRKYTARLGIDVAPTMTKSSLSAAIADFERRSPSAAAQRERIRAMARERKFGKDLVAKESRWNQFADDVGYMLAVYNRGKETIVDVLRVSEAIITVRGKLKLSLEAPKVVRDRHIGAYLDWDRHLELSIDALLYHEPLHAGFHSDGIDAYRKAVERGLKVARKL